MYILKKKIIVQLVSFEIPILSRDFRHWQAGCIVLTCSYKASLSLPPPFSLQVDNIIHIIHTPWHPNKSTSWLSYTPRPTKSTRYLFHIYFIFYSIYSLWGFFWCKYRGTNNLQQVSGLLAELTRKVQETEPDTLLYYAYINEAKKDEKEIIVVER